MNPFSGFIYNNSLGAKYMCFFFNPSLAGAFLRPETLNFSTFKVQ